MMVAQYCDFTTRHCVVCLEMVGKMNFMLCDFCHNSKKKEDGGIIYHPNLDTFESESGLSQVNRDAWSP